DPHTVVKAGDVVKVKVLEVDIPRKRIALSMRLSDEAARKPKVGAGGTAPAAASRKSGTTSAGAPRPAQRQPEPPGTMAAAFAKLKR
ncbi:MAG: S1 RNA-binding domain-containing protein, partial [Rhodocyclaceae bacterium]|nr:S1 RNA-binding domain-containing protein [Rhodocyclaceae bacterium]